MVGLIVVFLYLLIFTFPVGSLALAFYFSLLLVSFILKFLVFCCCCCFFATPVRWKGSTCLARQTPVRVLQLSAGHREAYLLFLCVWTFFFFYSTCFVDRTGNTGGKRRRLPLLTAHSCLRDNSPTSPATRCSTAGSPSTAHVGTEMLALWSPCLSSSRTGLIWPLKTPATDGPPCTGLLTMDR